MITRLPLKNFRNIYIITLMCLVCSCKFSQKNSDMNSTSFPQGTFGFDLEFMKTHESPVVLSNADDSAKIMIIPGWQARVMTSTAKGNAGFSYGWINYKLIEEGKPAEHINAFGGEERLWLGPEGGPFSLYFAPGKDQEFANWYVPAVLDTEAFNIVTRSERQAEFSKKCQLTNYSGTIFDLEITRKITLFTKAETEENLGISVPQSISMVGYETRNGITNTGKDAWTEKSGVLSIWMLSMLTPSPGVTVFIPYRNEGPAPVVNDDYFGKVPADRLIVKDGIIWFKADGKYRSKIGVSPERAVSICGSYDAEHKALTILWCQLPDKKSKYVNSKWGEQDDPFSGDVINSYNDGPVDDGTQMGPFYELESSSPAAFLKPGENLSHVQRIYHFEGSEDQLSELTGKVFGISMDQIKEVFTNQASKH